MPKLFITLLFAMSAFTVSAQKKDLQAAEFEAGITKENIQLLDVRTPDEFKTGHIENAVLADWNNEEQFKDKVAALDKTKPVFLYCRSGGRSGEAALWLIDHGFTEVNNLQGGILAWKKSGKTVVLP